jgi:hypothetical protein
MIEKGAVDSLKNPSPGSLVDLSLSCRLLPKFGVMEHDQHIVLGDMDI